LELYLENFCSRTLALVAFQENSDNILVEVVSPQMDETRKYSVSTNGKDGFVELKRLDKMGKNPYVVRIPH
jgi:hypothetical protein